MSLSEIRLFPLYTTSISLSFHRLCPLPQPSMLCRPTWANDNRTIPAREPESVISLILNISISYYCTMWCNVIPRCRTFYHIILYIKYYAKLYHFKPYVQIRCGSKKDRNVFKDVFWMQNMLQISGCPTNFYGD